MATTIKLPETKPYRVVIAGAVYNRHKEELSFDGKPIEVVTRELAMRGQEIQLTQREAHRLTELDAVKPADSELGYYEMAEDELEKLAKKHRLTVRSTGADPDKPLRTDYVNALETYDAGKNAPAGDQYDAMDKQALEAEAEKRKLDVKGTGQDGNVLVDDLRKALREADSA